MGNQHSAHGWVRRWKIKSGKWVKVPGERWWPGESEGLRSERQCEVPCGSQSQWNLGHGWWIFTIKVLLCWNLTPSFQQRQKTYVGVAQRNSEKGALSHIWGYSGHREQFQESRHKWYWQLNRKKVIGKRLKKSRSSWESTQILTRKLDFSQWEGGSSLCIMS